MGAASSGLSTSTVRSQQDEITVVSERKRNEGEDPILERIRSLKIVTPLLKSPSPSPSDSSFSEILFNKSNSSSSFVYRDWMEEKAKRISRKQEELENKLEIADALSVKLLQRYNHSVTNMRTTAYNLSQVGPLQIEVGELKGRLTEVISNCDALCKRIETIDTRNQTFNSTIVKEPNNS
ncbi:hypothetical protein ZOSMA_37G00940 [Zostera marina]|uniref:Uncharacterized protein n=1 Tax=Zostera marina TaxID=29655 RepID=A0A0K9P5E1_ZOSMR|nr:hypothetical protein ZOSMA_37G00940 [Zostera marina]